MKTFRLVVLFVLALVLFLPAVGVEAADGTGREVADTAEGWFYAAAWIIGIVLLVIGGILAVSISTKYHARFAAMLPKIDADPNILAFGRSIPGRALNDVLGRLLPQVDETTDPFIQRVQALTAFKKAQEWGLIDGKTFSELASKALSDAIRLTNGVPDVSFSLLGYDSTQTPLTGNFQGSVGVHGEPGG